MDSGGGGGCNPVYVFVLVILLCMKHLLHYLLAKQIWIPGLKVRLRQMLLILSHDVHCGILLFLSLVCHSSRQVLPLIVIYCTSQS